MAPANPWPWLLSHAILACSPHHVQPWRVRVVGDREGADIRVKLKCVAE
jgi:nitroreductase